MNKNIFLIVLFACFVSYTKAQQARIDSGAINGARYKIVFPPNWKNKLVMYAHGYEFVNSPSFVDNPELVKSFAVFLDRGFAVAASGYRGQGYVLPQGIEDTEALRKHFVKKYGKPDTTFMVGHSMGGGISLGISEKYAASYQGALPLCPLSSNPYIQTRKEFDLIAVFNVLFPGQLSPLSEIMKLGSPEKQIQQVFASAEPIQKQLAKDSLLAKQLAQTFDLKVQDLPFAVLFGEMVLRDLVKKAGGNPFDNTNTLYSGFPDDWMVNQKVERLVAIPAAYQFLQKDNRTGEISFPVVMMHTTYDQLIPAKLAVANYDLMVRQKGKEKFLIVKYTNGQGHCQFTPEQTASAFDELRQWVKSGKRPASGSVQ